MSVAEKLGLRPLHETDYDPEGLLAVLGENLSLPHRELALAIIYAEEIEPGIVALLKRAGKEELDPASARLLFRGLHILGGRQLPAGFPALVAFLRAPSERVESLLGNAIDETLARIIAGMFDRNAEGLFALIADADADSIVRATALRALSFLCFDGKVDKLVVEMFLRRFDRERMAPPRDPTWHAWVMATAMLGFSQLSEPAVAAITDGRIPARLVDERLFRDVLAEALERPADRERFETENLGYIEDILEALQVFSHEAEDPVEEWESDWPEVDRAEELAFAAAKPLPARNPWRDVGRNDPCPCGSGKKFKNCCISRMP
jgi:uncharacterized protein DUF1186/SEC-C motif-containing protein